MGIEFDMLHGMVWALAVSVALGLHEVSEAFHIGIFARHALVRCCPETSKSRERLEDHKSM